MTDGDPRITPWHTRLWGYLSKSATERYLTSEVIRLRKALVDVIEEDTYAGEFKGRCSAIAEKALTL